MALQDDLRLYQSHDWSWTEGTCGHCGRPSNFAVVAGCSYTRRLGLYRQHLEVCSACQGMNVLVDGGPMRGRHPRPLPGTTVAGLDEDVAAAWQEARAALGAGAATASEHMCRKILIHIAAGIEGAPKKMSFQEAVDLLVSSGTISAGMRDWVGKIRENGNEAAHELQQVPEDRARVTLEFTQQLLQVVYETKHRLEQLTNKR